MINKVHPQLEKAKSHREQIKNDPITLGDTYITDQDIVDSEIGNVGRLTLCVIFAHSKSPDLFYCVVEGSSPWRGCAGIPLVLEWEDAESDTDNTLHSDIGIWVHRKDFEGWDKGSRASESSRHQVRKKLSDMVAGNIEDHPDDDFEPFQEEKFMYRTAIAAVEERLQSSE